MRRRQQKPGIRQRELLDVMARNGGIYPPHWKMTYAIRQRLEVLRDSGWVTLARHSSGVEVYRIAEAPT